MKSLRFIQPSSLGVRSWCRWSWPQSADTTLLRPKSAVRSSNRIQRIIDRALEIPARGDLRSDLQQRIRFRIIFRPPRPLAPRRRRVRITRARKRNPVIAHRIGDRRVVRCGPGTRLQRLRSTEDESDLCAVIGATLLIDAVVADTGEDVEVRRHMVRGNEAGEGARWCPHPLV